MGIFDVMLQSETKTRFTMHRDQAIGVSEREKEKLRAYVFSESCTQAIERLAAGDFFIDPPEEKPIKKSLGGKKRILYLFAPEIRMLMSYMAFVAGERYDALFTDSLYSFRTSRNAVTLSKQLGRLPRLNESYKVRTDVRAYFNSIDEEKLVGITDRVFAGDPAFAQFLHWLLLRRTYTVDGVLTAGHPGAIPGMPLSNFLANLYLMDVDKHFAEQCRFYARYADDILILTDNREQMLQCRALLEAMLCEKGLGLNEEKTRNYMPGEPFEMMGFSFSGKEIDISEHAIMKIERKVKRRAERILYLKRKHGFSDEEAMRRMISKVNAILFHQDENRHVLNWTVWTFPVITTTKGLKRIDAIMQKYIRYAATGTLSDRQYRAKYAKMRELGYRTTVHAYYRDFLKDER